MVWVWVYFKFFTRCNATLDRHDSIRLLALPVTLIHHTPNAPRANNQPHLFQKKKNFFQCPFSVVVATNLLVVNNSSVETLGLLDVDSLDVRVELLLGALLVVTLTGDAHTETERNALDTAFPDLLVQLGVEADVAGALLHG